MPGVFALQLFALLACYAPGIAAARLVSRDLPGPVRLATCWAAVPVVFSVLAVPLGALGVDPMWILVGIGLAGLGLILALRAWREWLDAVRTHPWIFALPFVLLILGALLPPDTSVTADTNAHVAAIRRSVEERAVFPERGFHGDELSRGVDPRFGTLHAFYGAASRLTGGEPRDAWDGSRSIGLAIIVSGALAILSMLSVSRVGLAVGLIAVVAVHGGVYYNVLSVAAYPLWMSLGVIWTLLGLTLASGTGHRRSSTWVAGFTLAGLVGIHFFAFMLGGFLLASWFVAAPRGERRISFAVLAGAGLLALPWVGLRLASSYVNDNPIHQKIWQCMEWAPGLYSASPVFVAGWLFPFGAIALVWGLLRWPALRELHAYRWLMTSAALALAWITVPWLLTPSMEWIGFLPLRLLMAVGTAFLLALLVDRAGRRRAIVAAAVVLLMVPALIQRIDRARTASPGVDRSGWTELVGQLESGSQDRPVVLSDPFTMLALSADAPVDVVAVPDGRSSPRDGQAVERLRDSWRGMSPTIDGRSTDEVLRRRDVTHVVVNQLLPPGLSSYEYPVDATGHIDQWRKFALNPERFRELWTNGEVSLFEVRQVAEVEWVESWLGECAAPRPPGSLAVAIGDGYGLLGAGASVVAGDGRRTLLIDGALVWDESGVAPDRELVVRLDRVPGPVPEYLQPVGKPIRKLKEAFGAPRARYRWAVAPGMGRCPTWRAGEVEAVALGLSLSLPEGIQAGEYLVTLAARDRSVFEPMQPGDLFVDDDSWRGPEISRVTIR